jgi:hypothetical protein
MKNLTNLTTSAFPILTRGRTPRSNRFLPLLSGALLAAGPASGDLVSYYTFDDETNTDLIGDNDGQVNNQTGYSDDTPDGSPRSLDLSGTGPEQDYVRIGPEWPGGPDFGISDTHSFTISMWVNYTFSERGIFSIKQDLTSVGSDRSGITFGLNDAGNPFLGLIHSTGDSDSSNTSPTYHDVITDQVVPVSTWTHLAATYDSEQDLVQIYVDGVAATTYTDGNPTSTMSPDGSMLTGGVGTIDFVDSDGSFTGLGASGNGPAHSSTAGDFTRLFYDGLLDDLAIWNQALSGDGIALLAGGTSPPDIPLGSAPLEIIALDFDFPASSVTLTWHSRPEETYTLESSLNLINWSVHDDDIASEGETTTYVDSTVPDPSVITKLFYRIRETSE